MIERKDLSADYLNDLVHDVASDLATNANNNGLKEQLSFLTIICGWTEEEILAHVNRQFSAL